MLFHKEIDIAPSFDWVLVAQTGLDDLIRDFLTYTYLDACGVPLFTCDWDRLFRVQESIYKEFLMEFYAIIAFNPTKALGDRIIISFRLCGVSRECSTTELATRVGIYIVDETRSIHF